MPNNLPDEPALVHQTIQASVVERLRQMILSRRLLPGQRLAQDELARLLGVSRTPIREALHRLASEGLVTLSPYRGASVANFSVADLEEIYAVRLALESYAARLAAQSITEQELDRLEDLLHVMQHAFEQHNFNLLLEAHHEFHATLYAASKKQRLSSLASQYLKLTDVYQRMALSLGRGAKDPVVEHGEILEALRRRDAEQVEQMIRTHLRMTVEELQALFDHGPADPAAGSFPADRKGGA
ncbi:MAG: GntR family transcriptional regulator [Chloroflexia bacterium]